MGTAAEGDAVDSKIKIAGHPVHPMLVAFPVACYAGILVGFAVYAANGHLFWLNLAIALSVTALGLFLAAMASSVTNWNGPAISATWASCCPPSASRSPSPPDPWAGRWCRTTTSACT